MDRYDAYFGMLVGATDIDTWFDAAEAADRAIVQDHGLRGIVAGLSVAEAGTPNLTVTVGSGTAYDPLGRRVRVPGSQVVDLASHLPIGAGNERIASVCLRFDRALSDPRVDGNSVALMYQVSESFEIVVLDGTEAAANPVAPNKEANLILLADVHLTQGQTQIFDADIDMDTLGRRDWCFEIAVGALDPVRVGRLSEVLQANRQVLHDHISSVAFAHPAETVTLDDTSMAITATEVQTAIEQLDEAITTGSTMDADGGYERTVERATLPQNSTVTVKAWDLPATCTFLVKVRGQITGTATDRYVFTRTWAGSRSGGTTSLAGSALETATQDTLGGDVNVAIAATAEGVELSATAAVDSANASHRLISHCEILIDESWVV